MELQQKQEAEVKKEKDEEWKRKEHGYEKAPVWEKWPTFQ